MTVASRAAAAGLSRGMFFTHVRENGDTNNDRILG